MELKSDRANQIIRRTCIHNSTGFFAPMCVALLLLITRQVIVQVIISNIMKILTKIKITITPKSRDHNYPQEDPDQRLMLCQLLQLLRQVVANVYAVTLFFNFFFRVILIRFSDRGLVVDGKPELALFNQVVQ